MIRRKSGLRILFLGVVWGIIACDPGNAAESVEKLASVECDLVDLYGVSLNAKADLGTLPQSTQGLVEVRVRNTLPHTIVIDNIVGAGSQLSPKVVKGEVAPGETILLTFNLRTGSQSGPKGNSVAARLQLADDREANVTMVYKLAETIRFLAPAAVVDLPATASDVRFSIPFIITDPITLESLQIEKDVFLEQIPITWGRNNESHVLEGRIDADIVPDEGLSGKITLRSSASKKKADVELIIRKATPVRLSPTVVRMSKNKQGTQWQGSAIVRIDRDEFDAEQLRNAIVDATVQDKAVKIETRDAGNGIYRLVLRLDIPPTEPDLKLEPDAAVKVDVRVGKKSFSNESQIRLN